jgi:hypothetical protein
VGHRVVHFSDLTNEIIEDDREVVRLVIVEHPALRSGPVSLEVSERDLALIRSGALSVVSLRMCRNNGAEPEMVTMEIEMFNRLAGDKDIADIIHRAEPACTPRKQTNSATAPTTENHGIWPWLVVIALTLVVAGLLAWTGQTIGLWTELP